MTEYYQNVLLECYQNVLFKDIECWNVIKICSLRILNAGMLSKYALRILNDGILSKCAF